MYYKYSFYFVLRLISETVSQGKHREVSPQQIEKFMSLYAMNARPIQEPNERIFELIEND